MNYLLDQHGNKMYAGDSFIYVTNDDGFFRGLVKDHPSDNYMLILWEEGEEDQDYRIDDWDRYHSNKVTKENVVHRRMVFG